MATSVYRYLKMITRYIHAIMHELRYEEGDWKKMVDLGGYGDVYFDSFADCHEKLKRNLRIWFQISSELSPVELRRYQRFLASTEGLETYRDVFSNVESFTLVLDMVPRWAEATYEEKLEMMTEGPDEESLDVDFEWCECLFTQRCIDSECLSLAQAFVSWYWRACAFHMGAARDRPPEKIRRRRLVYA